MVNLKWEQLEASPDPTHGTPCARSSHAVSLIDDGTLLVFGGEHVARTPIEEEASNVWLCDLQSLSWKRTECQNSPPSRIAHAQCVYQNRYVYIFGGRAGITMDEKAMNDLWVLDTKTFTWKQIAADLAPEARSFHRMICVGDALYVFGGCGVNGRMNDLSKFDLKNYTWTRLGSSVLRGRGGANLLPLGSKVAVIAGFAGEETNDGHCFDIASETWDEDALGELDAMRPRSVCISANYPSLGLALIFGGEVDPSDRGHEGAGGFENDIVVLRDNGAVVETIKSGENWPEQRGWSDAGSFDNGNGTGELYVFGGLSGDDNAPQRLGDLWKLTITKD